MGIRLGSWGTPELGITEALQRVFQGNNTSNPNGGSNLLGSSADFRQAALGSTGSAPTNQGSTSYTGNYQGRVTQGGVLGANTSSGGTGGGQPQQQQPADQGGSYIDPYSGLRNEINSGWDQYLGSLDQQLYSLGDQRTAQEGIANSQFNQGVNTLDLSKTQGMDQLGNQRVQAEQNQAKTLRDLGSNLKNSFMAGNVYLGSRGAGDSSAANQYAFALTKMGSQQRGDIMNNTSNIMNDIAGRETNLTNIYNTEKKNLQEGLNQQISGIAQWYSQAIQGLQMQKAQGQLSKSQDLQSLSKDILNQALSQLSTYQQQAAQRQSSLDSWAMSNSTNLSQLKQNLSSVASPSYQLPQAQALTGTPQFTSDGRIFVPSGYGNNTTEKKTSLFG